MINEENILAISNHERKCLSDSPSVLIIVSMSNIIIMKMVVGFSKGTRIKF